MLSGTERDDPLTIQVKFRGDEMYAPLFSFYILIILIILIKYIVRAKTHGYLGIPLYSLAETG